MYEGGEFIVVFGDWAFYYHTTDGGQTWATRALPDGCTSARGIAFGAGFWVLIGSNLQFYTSTDGINWTSRFTGNAGSGAFNLSYSLEGGFISAIATAAGPAGQYSSPDGINWTYRSAGLDHGRRVVSNGTIQLSYTPTAFTYRSVNWGTPNLENISPSTVDGIYWSSILQKFCVGFNKMSVSADGDTWTQDDTMPNGQALGHALDDPVNSRVLVPARSGKIFGTTDGVVWAQVADMGFSPATTPMLSFDRKRYYITPHFELRDRFYSSQDLINWTTHLLPAGSKLFYFASGRLTP